MILWISLPVGEMIPGDKRPGTAWGMMREFSGNVTLSVRFGGLPGLELSWEKIIYFNCFCFFEKKYLFYTDGQK